MDDGLLRRLANICKQFYTLSTIDDLFLYAGAKAEWRVDDTQTDNLSSPFSNPSQRVRRFYGWTEGINNSYPSNANAIVYHVINQIIANPELPEVDRTIIKDEQYKLESKAYNKGIEIEPLLSTLSRSLASGGHAKEVAIITSSEASLEWFTYSNFGSVEVYNLILAIPFKLFEQIKSDRDTCEQVILEHVIPLTRGIEGEAINKVVIVCTLLEDDKWRDKALAWLTGQNVNNQGRVRSDNVASRISDGLQFRSEPEIHLYKALKSLGVSFAPLPVFVRGGKEYRRIEPDFVILKEGIIVIIEVDGDTFHRETPSEAYNRTTMLEHEGARIIRVQAREVDTPEKAIEYSKTILQTINKFKGAGR